MRDTALWKNCLKTSRTYENFPCGTCRTKKDKLRDFDSDSSDAFPICLFVYATSPDNMNVEIYTMALHP